MPLNGPARRWENRAPLTSRILRRPPPGSGGQRGRQDRLPPAHAGGGPDDPCLSRSVSATVRTVTAGTDIFGLPPSRRSRGLPGGSPSSMASRARWRIPPTCGRYSSRRPRCPVHSDRNCREPAGGRCRRQGASNFQTHRRAYLASAASGVSFLTVTLSRGASLHGCVGPVSALSSGTLRVNSENPPRSLTREGWLSMPSDADYRPDLTV